MTMTEHAPMTNRPDRVASARPEAAVGAVGALGAVGAFGPVGALGAVDAFGAGFRALLAACGIPGDLSIAVQPSGRPIDGDADLARRAPVLLSTSLDDLSVTLVTADIALATAGRVLVLVSANTASDPLLTIAHEHDPLVASSIVQGIAIADPIVGLALPLADAVGLDDHLPADARTLVTAAGRAAAAIIERQNGEIIVVGTERILDNRWLAAGDTAAFVAWALTGTLETETLPMAVKLVRPGSRGEHALPLTVHSPGDDAILAMLPAGDISIDDPAFAMAAARAGRLLSPEVHDALVDFVDRGHPSGALLVRGLPVGNLPTTPPSPRTATSKDRVSEFVLLTAARRLGQPIGYAPEHSGELVQNLVPTATAATSQTSTSSAVVLEFHTEAAFHPHKPRFLLLLCLRSDPFREAKTLLCSIDQVLADLPLGVRHTLTEARFRTGVDESYTTGRSAQLGRPMPVLAGDPAHPTLTFDADLMVGIDPAAQEALQELRRVVKVRHIGVALEAGDLLVVDNSAAVHGRSPFRARFDGTDRWLQRTFVVADLSASAADRQGRVVTTRFVG